MALGVASTARWQRLHRNADEAKAEIAKQYSPEK